MNQDFRVRRMGQVFTPPEMVGFMWSLAQNKGRVLEPSCGNGAFLRGSNGREVVAVEKDSSIAPKGTLVMDFFNYATENKFDTIIGNPPYVKNADIGHDTRFLLSSYGFDRRSNLYLFFIQKACHHLNKGGEIVFVTPRDFIKLTSARRLNRHLHEHGAFTHFVEYGDDRVFSSATPNVCVWRWVKGLRQRSVLSFSEGQFLYASPEEGERLSDHFEVKVGAVSGADNIFASATHGNESFVCSQTKLTGRLRRMIYNKKCASLEPFKERLLRRKVKPFTEENWWMWGRNYHRSNKPRIYVNCKTRQKEPFFLHDAKAYDGSVLALLPKGSAENKLDDWVRRLNTMDWEKLGFVCGGRKLFSQQSLQNVPI